jgi:tRNA threonylcarbamoyladenosine biosynthesis protein TsaB
MNVLAIDTATEQCSVALLTADRQWSRVQPTPRAHADLILPMVADLLRDAELSLQGIDCLAFGRGPGSFTGVRIAASVAQGLALSCNLPVVAVSDLAAVALQLSALRPAAATALICMDARMGEVYWARYRVAGSAELPELLGQEQVGPPGEVTGAADAGAGTGWAAYPQLGVRYPDMDVEHLLPQALHIAQLGRMEYAAGRAVHAAQAQPIYVRDHVVQG